MTAVPNVTKKDFELWESLEQKRLAAQREAKAYEKQQEEIEQTKFLPFVKAKGGKERTVSRSGYVLAIRTKRCSVSWKEAYIDVAGLPAAEELIQNAGEKEVLSVERAA